MSTTTFRLFEFPSCAVHLLLDKSKSLIDMGPLCIDRFSEPAHSELALLSVNKSRFQVNRTTCVIRLAYSMSVSYLLDSQDGGYVAFTVKAAEDESVNLDGYFNVLCRLVPYEDAIKEESLKVTLEQHWPYACTNRPIYEGDYLQKALNFSGNVVGKGFQKFGEFVKGGIDSASDAIENKIQNKSKINLQKARTVLSKVKSGGSKVFSFSSKVISYVVDPVFGKVKELNRKICQKIDNSNNRPLNYIKCKLKLIPEFTSTSTVSIQNAFYGLADAVKSIGGSFGSGASKIMKKKFGSDEEAEEKTAHGNIEEPSDVKLDKEISSIEVQSKIQQKIAAEVQQKSIDQEKPASPLKSRSSNPLQEVDTVRSHEQEPENQTSTQLANIPRVLENVPE